MYYKCIHRVRSLDGEAHGEAGELLCTKFPSVSLQSGARQ